MLIVATEDDTVHAIDSASREARSGPGRSAARSRSRAALRQYRSAGYYRHPGYRRGMRGALSRCDGRRCLGAAATASLPSRSRTARPFRAGRSSRRRRSRARTALQPRDQNQRGALLILDGRLYVPYGGHFGDCGDYYGWVVGISLRNPRVVVSWRTRARGGGIWAPGGITSDGPSLFVVTGNTLGATVERWRSGVPPCPRSASLRPPGELFRRVRLARARWPRRRSRRHQPAAARCPGGKPARCR